MWLRKDSQLQEMSSRDQITFLRRESREMSRVATRIIQVRKKRFGKVLSTARTAILKPILW
jgi:hypothetical protein